MVRDLDVLIENLEAYRDGLDEADRPGLDPLLSLWRRQRDDGPAGSWWPSWTRTVTIASWSR